MAQDLGLHQHSKVLQTPQSTVEETLGQLWYDEYKRRLWVKLFSWDRLGSLATTSLLRVRYVLIKTATWLSL